MNTLESTNIRYRSGNSHVVHIESANIQKASTSRKHASLSLQVLELFIFVPLCAHTLALSNHRYYTTLVSQCTAGAVRVFFWYLFGT
jgi:hypothetical protein